MPLQDCPECSRRVSDKATSCPGCGYPFLAGDRPPQAASSQGTASGAAPPRQWRGSPLLLFLILFALFVIPILWASEGRAIGTPTEAEHRAFLARRYPKLEQDTGFLNFFAALSGKSVRLQFRNYGVFSTVTLEVNDGKGNTATRTVTTGAFGRVW